MWEDIFIGSSVFGLITGAIGVWLKNKVLSTIGGVLIALGILGMIIISV